MSQYYRLNEDHSVSKCEMLEGMKGLEELHKNGKAHVGLDFVDGKKISTVFLCMDHGFSCLGDPVLLFETMIFDDSPDGFDYQERYSTWEEAEEGHKRAIEYVKEGTSVE